MRSMTSLVIFIWKRMVFLINGTGYVYYTIGSERVYHKTLINSRVFTEVYTNEDEGGAGTYSELSEL